MIPKKKQCPQGDVTSNDQKQAWFYSDIVKNHFFHPRNFMDESEDESRFDAVGEVGSPACGDALKVWLKVDSKTLKIQECRWRTFGCASAISAMSMTSVMVTENGGMTVDEALKIKPQDIIKRLHGLPDRKIHCSVLGDRALCAAIKNYKINH